ncbi:MAG: hypothetical protein HOI23_03825 [Deltaproteobacteria bacterium]|nr:hypothetical protein [Deltaproteobacteria bacterium]
MADNIRFFQCMGISAQVSVSRLHAYIELGMFDSGRAVGTTTNKHGGYREKFYP